MASRLTKLVCWPLLLLFWWLLPPATSLADHADEYLLKAAMTRNFIRFIQWPERWSAGKDNDSLTMCIMGDEEVAQGFRHVAGKKAQGRIIAMQSVDRVSKISGCDLLFVSRSATTHLQRIMAATRNRPILTIGETPAFARANGMIIFSEENGRIRFQINLETARNAGFTLGSRLLELAVIIDPSDFSGERQ